MTKMGDNKKSLASHHPSNRQSLFIFIRSFSLTSFEETIKTAINKIKTYYGFEQIKLKKASLISLAMLTAASLLLLNIIPIINTTIQASPAHYLLGTSGTWTLLLSIVGSVIWILRTYAPIKIALGIGAAATLLSLPLHAIINNSGGILGYFMVDSLFKLGIPEDVIVLLYGHLFIASTIPIGNPFFKLALHLKQLINPLHNVAVHDIETTSGHKYPQYPDEILSDKGNQPSTLITLSHQDR